LVEISDAVYSVNNYSVTTHGRSAMAGLANAIAAGSNSISIVIFPNNPYPYMITYTRVPYPGNDEPIYEGMLIVRDGHRPRLLLKWELRARRVMGYVQYGNEQVRSHRCDHFFRLMSNH
jgi:hypothetical protein